MKKLISIVLSFVMVISLLPLTVFAKEVQSIEYQPRDSVTAYYETNGEWRHGNDDGPDFFYYFGVVGYGQNDKLLVTYDSGDTVEFVGTYDEDGFAFVAENGDRISQNEFDVRDDQQNVHWGLGSDNYYYIEYAGKQAAIQVTIINNPIKAISFTPAGEITVTENTGGEWRTDDKGNEYYDYSAPDFSEGDVLSITYTESGDTVDYTYNISYENWEDTGFYDSERNKLDTDELYRVHTGDNIWQVGSDNNYFYVEYKKVKSQKVYVNVVENPVSRIGFVKSDSVVYFEGSNMYYDSWDDANYYNLPSFERGDQLIIYDKHDNQTVYTYTYDENESKWDGRFVCDGKEDISRNDVNIDGHQNQTPWTLGENECEVRYMGCSATFKVTIEENPVKSIEFIKKNDVVYYEGSHMHYDSWDDMTYYERPNFEEGDILIVHDSKGGQTRYTFSTETWEFKGDNGEKISTEDIQIYDNQREEAWTLGNNVCTVEYMGSKDTFYVSIIKNPVTSISFTPVNSAEFFENSNGMIDIDPEGNEFFYYWEPGFEEGDILTVNYSDTRGKVTYTAQRDGYEMNFVSASGDSISESEIERRSDQRKNHWSLGNDNYYTVSYMGIGTQVPVSIVVNPIASVSFTPKTPAVFTEGQQRYDEWDDRYYFDTPFVRPGDVMVIEYKDDRGKVTYTATYDEERDRTDFVAANGDVIEIDGNRDINVYSYQRECPWTVDGPYNYYIFEYKSFTVEVPVTINENNVAAIKITPPSPLTIYASQTVVDYDEFGNEFVHYNIPNMPDGTVLTITDKNGSDKDYVLTFDESDGERYFMNGDEKIHFYGVFVSDNQQEVAWTVGSDNYFTASYLGAECQVPVTIIESDVASISFTRQHPVVLAEYNFGEYKFNDQGNRFFEYRYTFGDAGDVLTVNYKNGTTKDYVLTVDGENSYFLASDGEKLTEEDVDAYDLQWEEPWSPGGNNFYVVSVHGVSADIPVIVEHEFEKNVVPPTCTEQGYTEYHCTACGEEFTDDFEKPLGHKTNKVVTPATLTNNGSINQVCQRCTQTISSTPIYKPTTFTLSKTTYTYNGKVQKPTVTVKDSKGKTIAASNYTLTYSNKNSKAYGKYTVKITFKGNYSGSKTLTYYISPKGTTVSKITSPKAKQLKVTWSKQTKDTNGYQIQIATDSKFTKDVKDFTVTSNKTTSKTLTNLKSKKKYYVRIRTYKTVKGVKCYSTWSGSKTFTTK